MVFKGRTVIVFVILAMFVSSVLTLTVAHPSFLGRNPAGGQSSGASSSGTSGLTTQDLNKVAKTYDLIQNRFLTQTDHDKVMNGAINGMLEALNDPYTTYMDPKEAKQFDETISSSFQGIGAEVSLQDGKVTIMSPIKGSPAEKAGLRANDVIATVNGEKLDGLTLNQAVLKIRGPKGTQAKLGIVRSGTTDTIEVNVVRDDISLETVYGEMLTDQVGKIEIRQFSTNTAKRFREELNALEAKGMKGLVIDVRNDPGGLLDSVVDIMENFVEKGKPIVQIEDRQGKKEATNAEGKYPVKKYPVTVLINNGSASASEILAGAFKESAGGTLVGEKSYGKGTVQITYEKEMGDGSNIKMTVFKWLTPNGNWIHQKGIEPDVAVEPPAYYKAAPFTKKETLKPDMVSDDVKTLQLMLGALNLKPDRTDGYFSAKTASELKAFQRLQNLPATGEADTATMNKLEAELIKVIKDPKNDTQLHEAVRVTEEALRK
ncbi:S41 family peptidase [Paenibacillus aurantius]|uniref:S41 family peptidase n=1 Tax=Paenibacillus aurantius TaxID=2918900 RepID=A0AA96RHZ1_9BACL|nr:S41 family peptidase [Paenibacillus aurantius]WNQ11624.1 S41 family peptidase [Paenibacillus aurantius]